MKKIDKRVWWSLPIILGVYLIFRQYSKKGTSISLEPTISADLIKDTIGGATNTVTPKYSSTYPLKIGSRDSGSPLAPVGLVVSLQKLINTRGYIPSGARLAPYTKLAEDGIFGSKTENAVLFWTGKKSIDSEFDLENLKDALVAKLPLSNTNVLF